MNMFSRVWLPYKRFLLSSSCPCSSWLRIFFYIFPVPTPLLLYAMLSLKIVGADRTHTNTRIQHLTTGLLSKIWVRLCVKSVSLIWGLLLWELCSWNVVRNYIAICIDFIVLLWIITPLHFDKAVIVHWSKSILSLICFQFLCQC